MAGILRIILSDFINRSKQIAAKLKHFHMIDNLTIQTKVLSDDLILPSYGTPGSVGLDFAVQEDVYIPPNTYKMIELYFNIKFPEGYFGLIYARSSLHKKGLMLANSVGVVDADYVGTDDTIKAVVYNFTDNAVYLSKGDRIIQLVLSQFVKPDQITIDFVDTTTESRGGFGSTGT